MMRKTAIHIIAIILMLLSAVAAPARRTDGVKLMYWNIQNGMWDGQTDNYERFVEWVSARKPDICVWAEAQTIFKTGTNVKMAPEDRYLTDGWKKLAARYGHRYVYIGGHRDNYPQVITSRLPIQNVRRFTDEDPDTVVPHGASWTKIKVNGLELNIVTVHAWPQKFSFEYNRKSRDLQKRSAERNEGDLYRLKEMKLICGGTILTDSDAADNLYLMLGDFNSISPADNDRYGFPADSTCFLLHDYILKNTPYVDSVREHSLPDFAWTTYQHLRYDYLYMTPALDARVKSIGVIYDEYTLPVGDPQIPGFCHPSDHLPIEAVFDMTRK